MTMFSAFKRDRARVTQARTAGSSEETIADNERRLGRARSVLAEPSQHSDARVRRACRTVMDLLPDDVANVDERTDASRMIALLNRRMPV